MIYFLLIRDNDAWQAFLVYWRSYEPMAFEECGEPNQKHKYRADELFIVLIFFFTSRGEKCSLFYKNWCSNKEVTAKSDFSCEPWELVGRGGLWLCSYAVLSRKSLYDVTFLFGHRFWWDTLHFSCNLTKNNIERSKRRYSKLVWPLDSPWTRIFVYTWYLCQIDFPLIVLSRIWIYNDVKI